MLQAAEKKAMQKLKKVFEHFQLPVGKTPAEISRPGPTEKGKHLTNDRYYINRIENIHERTSVYYNLPLLP